MPRFDGTGPNGQGSKSGRGMGPCGKGKRPGSNVRGRFFGMCQGSKNYWSKTDLTEYKENLEKELEDVKDRLVKS